MVGKISVSLPGLHTKLKKKLFFTFSIVVIKLHHLFFLNFLRQFCSMILPNLQHCNRGISVSTKNIYIPHNGLAHKSLLGDFATMNECML